MSFALASVSLLRIGEIGKNCLSNHNKGHAWVRHLVFPTHVGGAKSHKSKLHESFTVNKNINFHSLFDCKRQMSGFSMKLACSAIFPSLLMALAVNIALLLRKHQVFVNLWRDCSTQWHVGRLPGQDLCVVPTS